MAAEEGEVVVHFETSLPQRYHVPPDTLVLPASLARYGLSEVINHMLSFETPVPFDFLICGTFLRTTLGEYLKAQGLTAEKVVTVEYVLALRIPEPQDVDKVPDWVSDVVALSTSRFLATCYDGTLRVYDHNKTQLTLRMADVPLKSAAMVSLDAGSFSVCTGVQDGSVRCCNLRNQKGQLAAGPVATLRTASGQAVEAVAMNEDGSLLASSGWDSSVTLWNAEMPFLEGDGTEGKKRKAVLASDEDVKPKFTLQGHSQNVSCLRFGTRSVIPYTLFSGSWDCTVRVWDIVSASCLCTWPSGRAVTYISASAFSPAQLCSAHEDGHVSIWDIRAPAHPAIASAVRPDGSSTAVLRTAMHPHKRFASQVAWCPEDAHRIASVGHDGVVNLIDPRSPTMPIQSFEIPSPGKHPVKLLCATWLGAAKLATGGSDGQVRVHEVGPASTDGA